VKAGSASAVAGKTTVTTPELALCVTDVAPVTVKKLALTPESVYSAAGETVAVAV
jgi:hypothetical protein